MALERANRNCKYCSSPLFLVKPNRHSLRDKENFNKMLGAVICNYCDKYRDMRTTSGRQG